MREKFGFQQRKSAGRRALAPPFGCNPVNIVPRTILTQINHPRRHPFSFRPTMVKRDARFLSPAAQAEVRLRVLGALRSGLSQSEAAKVFGVSRWSVVQWVKAERQGGEAALLPKRRGRRRGEAGKLNAAQRAHVYRLIAGGLPHRLELPFFLWSRAAVQALIARECAVNLSLNAVHGQLLRWGLDPRHPLQRTHQRNSAITLWMAGIYPQIAARAKRERARIYWGSDAALRPRDAEGRAEPGAQGALVHSICALDNRGQVSFMVFEGDLLARPFLDFCQGLIQQSSHKVILIVAARPVHRSDAVRDWLRARCSDIELLFLPQ